MEGVKKVVRSIEEMNLNTVSKLAVSVTISMIWFLFLVFASRMYELLFSKTISSVIWVSMTLPLFGFLYHKFFNLIDTEVVPKNHQFTIESGDKNERHKLVLGRADKTTNLSQETNLCVMKHRLDLEKFSPVHVFLGDGNESLELFNKIFGEDIDSLAITSFSELQETSTSLKFLYIDISNISQFEMQEISKRVKKINDQKVLSKEMKEDTDTK